MELKIGDKISIGGKRYAVIGKKPDAHLEMPSKRLTDGILYELHEEGNKALMPTHALGAYSDKIYFYRVEQAPEPTGIKLRQRGHFVQMLDGKTLKEEEIEVL